MVHISKWRVNSTKTFLNHFALIDHLPLGILNVFDTILVTFEVAKPRFGVTRIPKCHRRVVWTCRKHSFVQKSNTVDWNIPNPFLVWASYDEYCIVVPDSVWASGPRCVTVFRVEGSISKAVLASHAAARIDPDVLKVRLKIPPVLMPEVVPSRPQLLLLEPPSLSLFHRRAQSM